MADSTISYRPKYESVDYISTRQESGESRECVVAVDPGSAKCGMAVVNRNGEAPFRSVVLAVDMLAELARVVSVYSPRVIVVGNGTGSKQMLELIRNALPALLPIQSVSEAYTSEEARKRCVREQKPKGFQRLLPQSLRTPSQPYDDYVALILGERYWKAVLSDPRSDLQLDLETYQGAP